MTPLIPACLSSYLGSGSLPRIPPQDRDTLGFPGWFVGMCCYPPVELIYVEFYLPPHLDISRVIITTLYMPVHSARRHIHQTLVTGYSFINDQIHFCRITALWCMGRRGDAGQTDTQAHTAECVAGCCVVDRSHDHIQWKKWQNQNFEPIRGSWHRHEERQDVSFIFRKFYFKVFNLLSFFGSVSRIWQPPERSQEKTINYHD